MNTVNNDADQIIQEAEELLKEIKDGAEALEADVLQPINEINAMTNEVEADFNVQEDELIDLNEAFLSENEKSAAEALARTNHVLADESDIDVEE